MFEVTDESWRTELASRENHGITVRLFWSRSTNLVTVAVADPPKVSQGQYVSVERLQAMPWVQNGNSRVAFRAKSILPAPNGATTAPGAKPAPAPANH